MRVLPYSPTHSCLTDQAFLYTGASNFQASKCFLSHWCQIRTLQLIHSVPFPILKLARQTSSDTRARSLALLHLCLPTRGLRTACTVSCWRADFATQYSWNKQQIPPKTKRWVLGFSDIYSGTDIKILSLDQSTLSWLINSLTILPIHPQLSFQEPSKGGGYISPSHDSYIGILGLSLMVGCEHSDLYWSGSGEPLMRQLYKVPVSKYFLASAIVSGFGVCMWNGSPCGAVSEWPFLQSLLYSLSLYFIYTGAILG